ncbi:MAG: NFACT RNA binding domain-containing protein, partial [Atribacterota bacterium]|nr:NFACT RNA binding domain-containing protein [Atribacterota bacterium]
QYTAGQNTQWAQLLHKYLVGGKILSIEQKGWDRILYLEIKNNSLWEETNEFYLFVELTGRNANCILTKKDDSLTILGAYRKITPEKNRLRVILPGHPYLLPPQKEKMDPFTLVERKVKPVLSPDTEKTAQWVINQVDGIGPFLGNIIATTISSQDISLVTVLSQLIAPLHQTPPPLFIFSSSPYELPQGIFWQNPLYHPKAYCKNYSSWNEAVKNFYHQWWEHKTREIQDKARRKRIQEELSFIDKEIQEVKNLLQEKDAVEEVRMKGELLKLLPALEVLEETETMIRVKNPFNGNETTIPLNPSLTKSQNMQHYFRLYRKMLNRNHRLQVKLVELEQKREKIFQDAGTQEESWSNELDFPSSPFRRFKTAHGSEIWIGKNQKSNQKLLRSASREDYWLHVRDLPGAHVILKLSPKGNQEEEIQQAAQLAGYFSAGKNDSKVEVIVTQVKYLHLVPGAIGKVLFRNERTILVQPIWPKDITIQEN